MSAETRSHYPDRVTLPHAVPSWVSTGATFFITINCLPRGENHLCNVTTAKAILDSIQFQNSRAQWYASLVVLMPDHMHALIAFPQDLAMRPVIASWKRFVARQEGIRWQRDFFDHRIRDNRELVEKTNYIRENPVRKGIVGNAADWPYIWEPGRDGPPARPACGGSNTPRP